MEPKDALIVGNLIGHQGRCFDLRLSSSDSNILLSASEDGTAKLWNVNKRCCTQTLVHNKDAEVLRAAIVNDGLICTAGSDGNAKLWKNEQQLVPNKRTEPCATLMHKNESSQIYVCEPLISSSPNDGNADHISSAVMITAADSEVFLWDIETQQINSTWEFAGALTQDMEGFGGDSRNPDREVYVFDAKWRPNSFHEVSVALSDSTLRMLDTRQKDPIMTLSLEIDELAAAGVKLGHATSVNWDSGGIICSISFGSGIVALIDVSKGECLTLTRAHQAPCYGALFADNLECTHCLSWSADSTISSWKYSPNDNGDDVTVQSVITVKDLSILSCCFHSSGNIICGGGSKSAGGRGTKAPFLGTPIQIVSNPLLHL